MLESCILIHKFSGIALKEILFLLSSIVHIQLNTTYFSIIFPFQLMSYTRHETFALRGQMYNFCHTLHRLIKNYETAEKEKMIVINVCLREPKVLL